MTLRTTLAGLALLTAFERIKLKGYRCPAGIPTIGRGITTGALKDAGERVHYVDGRVLDVVIVNGVISAAEERRLFKAIVDHFENAVERLLKGAKVNVVEPCEFDSMTSLSWNIGIAGFSGSSVLRLYRRGDKRGAAEAFLAWNKATVNGRKVVVKGLVRRRQAERALFLGDYEAASALAQTELGPMPQKIETPAKREPVLKSPSANAQIGVGGLGGLVAIEGAKQAIDTAGDVRSTAQSAGELFGLSGSAAVLIGLGLIIVGVAGWTWWRRYRRSRVEDRVETEGVVDLAIGAL